jgi:hypothetical protein
MILGILASVAIPQLTPPSSPVISLWDHWQEQICSPAIADAILDRLIHNFHKIKMKGGSLRKNMPT